MFENEKRKEKVLHTRVSQNLDTELRDRAKGLGISVSNLVRNVLSHSFGLVGDIVVDGANIGRAARGEELQPNPRAPLGVRQTVVLGWQEAILNLNAVCSDCNALMPKGTRAAIAVTDGPGPKSMICEACLKELQSGTNGE